MSDLFEQLCALGEKAGMRPTAVSDFATLRADQFHDYKGSLIHSETGLGASEYVAKELPKIAPHYFPSAIEDDLEAAAFGEFGKPNMTKRGELYKKLGPIEFAERAKIWGLNGPNDMRPGKRPAADGADAAGDKSKAKPDRANPWLAANWNISAQGKLVKAIGLEKAQGIARAAGSFVGATRPARGA